MPEDTQIEPVRYDMLVASPGISLEIEPFAGIYAQHRLSVRLSWPIR